VTKRQDVCRGISEVYMASYSLAAAASQQPISHGMQMPQNPAMPWRRRHDDALEIQSSLFTTLRRQQRQLRFDLQAGAMRKGARAPAQTPYYICVLRGRQLHLAVQRLCSKYPLRCTGYDAVALPLTRSKCTEERMQRQLCDEDTLAERTGMRRVVWRCYWSHVHVLHGQLL
jgi:hypothetical protein